MSANMLGEALRELRGPLGDLINKLSSPEGDEWLTALKRFLRKENPWDGVAVTFLRDMRKDGWELVEDVTDDPVPASQLELVSFLKRGESYVSGEEMRKRAKEKKAALGQRQSEYLLEPQEEIPSEWRNYYLVFPGTLWRGRDGGLDVPYLNGDGHRWGLCFGWLEGGWCDDVRLLRSK